MDPVTIETYTDLGNQEEYMRWLQRAIDARDEAEKEILECVLGARAQGASWQKIGTLLGISKQAAQQKYSHYEAVKPNIPVFKEA